MKKVITLLIVLCISFVCSINTALASNAEFTIGSNYYYVDGLCMPMDVSPYIKDSRTFMPLRYAAYSLGVVEQNIIWDNEAKVATFMKGDKVVQVKIGSTTMLINGVAVSMDVAPEIKDGRVMLPLRFIAQAFGSTISWDANTKTARLSTNDEPDTDTSVNQPITNTTLEPKKKVISYEWNYRGEDYNWDITLDEDTINEVLEYYRSKNHPLFDPLRRYVFVDTYTHDTEDDRIISIIVDHLKGMAEEEGYDDNETVEFVLAFVQGFPYLTDSASTGYDEYPRYPLETFLERCGDCEDTAIFAGVLLREMGYGSALLFLTGHCSLGVYGGDNVTGSYYEYDGKKYFYTEMTSSGWRIGQVPRSEKGEKAIVVPLL